MTTTTIHPHSAPAAARRLRLGGLLLAIAPAGFILVIGSLLAAAAAANWVEPSTREQVAVAVVPLTAMALVTLVPSAGAGVGMWLIASALRREQKGTGAVFAVTALAVTVAVAAVLQFLAFVLFGVLTVISLGFASGVWHDDPAYEASNLVYWRIGYPILMLGTAALAFLLARRGSPIVPIVVGCVAVLAAAITLVVGEVLPPVVGSLLWIPLGVRAVRMARERRSAAVRP
jgi:hypothetical protein